MCVLAAILCVLLLYSCVFFLLLCHGSGQLRWIAVSHEQQLFMLPLRRQCCGPLFRVVALSHHSRRWVTQQSADADASSSEPISVKKLAHQLPHPPYGLPITDEFEVERAGGESVRRMLQQDVYEIQDQRRRLGQRYLPNQDDFWRSPAHEGLEMVARSRPFYDALVIIMENSHFFLFDVVIGCRDAPLPHVMYEDFMKCVTFASLQKPPEEQFALPTPLLRTLVCSAAYYCTLDRHYFTSAAALFQRIEQEQHIGAELLSSWVYLHVAAGKVEEAIRVATYMSEHQLNFDARVFALMQHPSVNPIELHLGQVPSVARGCLNQERLCHALNTEYTADAVALHAMWVYYSLTLQHARKWELLRCALSPPASHAPTIPAARTWRMVLDTFAAEKGLRCGPKTAKALAQYALKQYVEGSGEQEEEGLAAATYILSRVRLNEGLPLLAGQSAMEFSEEELVELSSGFARKRSTRAMTASLHEDSELYDHEEIWQPMLQRLVKRPPVSSSGDAPAAAWYQPTLQGLSALCDPHTDELHLPSGKGGDEVSPNTAKKEFHEGNVPEEALSLRTRVTARIRHLDGEYARRRAATIGTLSMPQSTSPIDAPMREASSSADLLDDAATGTESSILAYSRRLTAEAERDAELQRRVQEGAPWIHPPW